jgi:glycerol uptake facilitator-like aquaporin
MPLSKKLAAEFFGTFWLVFGGCGDLRFSQTSGQPNSQSFDGRPRLG